MNNGVRSMTPTQKACVERYNRYMGIDRSLEESVPQNELEDFAVTYVACMENVPKEDVVEALTF